MKLKYRKYSLAVLVEATWRKKLLSGFLAFFVAFIGVNFSNKVASAGPSWSKQPKWASPARENYRSTADEDPYQPATPFSPGSLNLAIDVGQVFLMGELSDTYSDSIGAQVHFTYGVSDIFAFDSSIGFSSHSEGDFSMGSLLSGLRTNLSWYDKVIPYAIVGLGFYRPSFEFSPTNSVSTLLFGLHVGPGVTLQMTDRMFFGASLTFHDIFSDTKTDSNGDPVEVGGTYTSFFLNAGMSF